MDMPNMVKIRQRFARDRLDDPAAAVSAGLASSGLLDAVGPGMRIAVTAGSRFVSEAQSCRDDNYNDEDYIQEY